MAPLPCHLQALLPEPSELRLKQIERIGNLFSRRPETLSKYEQAFLMRLEAQDSGIWALRSITQEFTALMRDRDLNGLSDWMHKATATGVWTSRFRAASPARASFRHP